jgi:hypothetical protein
MAITSPFKKLGHSREGSREEPPRRQHQGSTHLHSNRPSQGPLTKSGTVTSNRSSASTTSTNLAQQYESDKQRLIKYCFSSYDSSGILIDSYITHVRVIEDAAYPSERPPSASSASNKKPRVLVLAVKKDGAVYLHKGRENSNGSFQIGRTWSLNELSTIVKEKQSDTGFTATLGKDYYWETSTSKERQVFVTSLVRIYRKFKNGLVPRLVNWDLSLFGLDEESYKVFLNKEVMKQPVSESPKKAQESPQRKRDSSPKKSHQKEMLPPLTVPSQVSKTVAEPKPLMTSTQVDQEIKPLNFTKSATTVPVIITGAPTSSAVPAAFAAATAASATAAAVASQTDRPSETRPPELALSPTVKRSMIDDALGQGVSGLQISEHGSKQEKARDELDIPKRYEPMQDSTSSSSGDAALERPQTRESITCSIKDVAIIAQRRSLAEFEAEEDDSYDDDITDLYQQESESGAVPMSANFDMQDPSIIITPADDDLSFENSYGESFDRTNASHEVLNATPREPEPFPTPSTIKGNNNSDDEYEYDDLNQPVEELQVPTIRGRRRAGTVNSMIEQPDDDQSSFDDIFDEINWDSSDDAVTLTAKLMKELTRTEYKTAKKLVDLRSNSSHLTQQTSKIAEECSKLIPLFNMFTVELAGFALDIKDLESEGQGLQVETINKKNLYNDLKKLLDTVSVDESSLQVLLTGDIDKDLYNLEATLADLESALDAIRGGDKDEDNLGEMTALRERRSKYETATIQFLRRLKFEMSSRFKYIVSEMEKYDFVDSVAFKDVLSEILVYAGLILFVRDASEDSYLEIITSWETAANPFYQNVISILSDNLIEGALSKHRFSLTNEVVFPSTVPVSRKRTSASTSISHERLREKFGLMDSSSATSIPRYSNDKNSAIEAIINTFQALQKHIILQQDYVVKFFHMSNEDPDLSSYISKYPIDDRPSLLTSSISEIDSDRANARDIYNILSNVFQPALETLLKTVVQCLRSNQKNTPSVFVWLELFDKQFSSSNQEYMLGIFKKLMSRLRADWEKFIDNECKGVEKNINSKKRRDGVSILVKNVCKFISEIEEECDMVITSHNQKGVSLSALECRPFIERSYVELCSAILKNLNYSAKDNQKIYRIHDGGELKEHSVFLINDLQNCNWIIEKLSPLKLSSLSPTLASLTDITKETMKTYVSMMVSEHFGKISLFVSEVDILSRESDSNPIDPSKRFTNNKDAINKLLAQHTSRDISMMVKNMRLIVEEQFHDSEGFDIQHQLIEKIWSALQMEFVTITMKLTEILDRYYKDIDHRFSKKDIIAAFGAARGT